MVKDGIKKKRMIGNKEKKKNKNKDKNNKIRNNIK